MKYTVDFGYGRWAGTYQFKTLDEALAFAFTWKAKLIIQ